MKITIETPNLIGHVLQTDVVNGVSTTHDTAMCGAKVTGPVENRRLVCGKCVKLLIANRNEVNTELDVLERQVKTLRRRLFDALDIVASLTPADETEDSDDTSTEQGDESTEADSPSGGE